MRNVAKIATVALVAIGLAGTAIGGPPTVKITGGGIAVNNNSGFGEFLSVGGFSAIMKGDKVKGQIQARSVLASNPTIEVSSIHGKVVCVEHVGGGVWEVRFIVTKATGLALAAELLGGHGSLFVLDGGSPGAGNDMIDEGFADPDTAACGGVDAGRIGLEPVLAGNFTVH